MATIAYSCCIFLIALTLGSVNANYCRQRACGAAHTMCRFQSALPSRECGQVYSVGLTAEEKDAVLRLHNALRAKVASGQETRGSPGPQPAARDLGPLQWDEEIANIAQRWANQCDFNHDKCRNVDRFPVGQNIAFSSTTGSFSDLNLGGMVQDWYDEVQYFDRNQVDSLTKFAGRNGEVIGHYTQLVWAKTTLLGCGAIRYTKDGWNTVYLVCNYGPSGNFRNQAVYQRR